MCIHLLLNPFIDRVTARLRVQASHVMDKHTHTRYSRIPRYWKWGTFSSGGSLPMTTLSRHASAARLLLDLTALSVNEPTSQGCYVKEKTFVHIFGELSIYNILESSYHSETKNQCFHLNGKRFFPPIWISKWTPSNIWF